jgi:hypothetical protein
MIQAALLATIALAQTEYDMAVIDDPSWDKTNHKNNEYLWKLQFGKESHQFKIAQLSDLYANGVAEDYLQT